MKNKLILLDFDGVINTIYFDENGKSMLGMGEKCVNYQAICWLNELYKKHKYCIVISSCWRNGRSLATLRKILNDSGLNKDICIIGKTPYLNNSEYHRFIRIFGKYFCIKSTTRGHEIDEWLKYHKTEISWFNINIEDFIILDDDCDMWKYKNHLVKCTQAGFTINEYEECLRRWNDEK